MDRRYWGWSAWKAGHHVSNRLRAAVVSSAAGLAAALAMYHLIANPELRLAGAAVAGFFAIWSSLALVALVEQRNALRGHFASFESSDARVPALLALKAEGQRLLNQIVSIPEAEVTAEACTPLVEWHCRAYEYEVRHALNNTDMYLSSSPDLTKWIAQAKPRHRKQHMAKIAAQDLTALGGHASDLRALADSGLTTRA